MAMLLHVIHVIIMAKHIGAACELLFLEHRVMRCIHLDPRYNQFKGAVLALNGAKRDKTTPTVDCPKCCSMFEPSGMQLK